MKDIFILTVGVLISAGMIVAFDYVMSLPVPSAMMGFMGLVFIPMILSMKPLEKFSIAGKGALLPFVTSMTFLVNWLIMGAITSILRDESYIAVLVLTGVVTILTTCVIWRAKPSLYWTLAISIICGIISVSAYVWAGVLFSPRELTGTSISPEEIVVYKTNFVFSWGWEIVLAVTAAFIVAIVPNYLKR